MTITIINDCKDENAKGRQQSRVSSIFGIQSHFIGVENDLEASGNLIDILDAVGDNKSIILVNIAPRHGKAKKWENGTPFGYFNYRNTLVVTTLDGYTLSLVKKFKLVEYIAVFDTVSAVDEMITAKYISKELRDHIVNTQFRSYELTPLVASYLVKKKKLKHVDLVSIDSIVDAPPAIWFIDNFGNCKTTLTTKDVVWKVGNTVKLSPGNFKMFDRLKDVPNKKLAVIIGSSGIGSNRFLELIIQGLPAAKRLQLSVGKNLFFTKMDAKN